MERVILKGGSALDLEKQAAGRASSTCRRAALNKVKGGRISLAEMNRVTKD
jgi:type IV pilus assembly protein PilB